MSVATAAAIVALALALALAGCGGGGGGGGETFAQARQRLLELCRHGHEKDPKDLAACRCIIARLQTRYGYTTAQRFERARRTLEHRKVPPAVRSASLSCQRG